MQAVTAVSVELLKCRCARRPETGRIHIILSPSSMVGYKSGLRPGHWLMPGMAGEEEGRVRAFTGVREGEKQVPLGVIPQKTS